MTQIYYADYNSDTTGATPSGWEVNDATNFLPVISTSNAYEGAKCVQLVKKVGAPTGNHWFAIDTGTNPGDGDAEITCTVYFADDANMRSGPAFRGKDAATNECYVMMMRASNTMRLSYISGTSETTKSTQTISTYSTGTHYHIKAYANGTALKGKYWADGDSEPGTWTIDTTDSTLDNTNTLVGGYLFNGSDNSNSVYFDVLEVNDFNVAADFVPKIIFY